MEFMIYIDRKYTDSNEYKTSLAARKSKGLNIFHFLCFLGRTHIRLVDGPGPWKGTVEVETSRGRWGGFCWLNWNSKNTQAVCRTLQYRYYPCYLFS
jgi:hypothetical protein